MAAQQMKIKGEAWWAKVFEPDTHFDKKGIYSINVEIPETEAAHVCEQLDTMLTQHANQLVKEQPKLKATLSTRTPYENAVDKDGNETGKIVFKVKMKASGTTRDGRDYTQKPLVVDAKRTPMNGDTLIGNESIVKVAFEPVPYYVAASKQAGVSLRLKGVQVIQLELPKNSNASSMFDEEDGYVEEKVAKDTFEPEVDFDDTPTVTDSDEGDF